MSSDEDQRNGFRMDIGSANASCPHSMCDNDQPVGFQTFVFLVP